MRHSADVLQRGSPLPPITNIDQEAQERRCLHLRKAISLAVTELLRHYFHAYQKLQALGAEEEAELYGTVWKYGIVFDISKEEIEDAAETVNSGMVEQEGCETLRGLKSGLQKLLFIRKLFFCTVLAIEATEGNADFGKWSVAIQTMRHLTAETARFTTNIDDILNGEIS